MKETYSISSWERDVICNHFKKNPQETTDFEVCDMLSKIIEQVYTIDLTMDRGLPINDLMGRWQDVRNF